MITPWSDLWQLLALALGMLTLPGSVLLALLTVAGLLPARRPRNRPIDGRIALVVPAHDEERGIARTVDDLLAEVARDGASELVVVADNRSDATAAVARSRGARVPRRGDTRRCGKGCALDFAFRAVLAEDFKHFVVTDADSVVDPGFLAALRRHFSDGAMAAQARYTVLDTHHGWRTRLMELAFVRLQRAPSTRAQCARHVRRPARKRLRLAPRSA
jgi:1,2-diacylglycerol 3-beta-glucosyltransferase